MADAGAPASLPPPPTRAAVLARIAALSAEIRARVQSQAEPVPASHGPARGFRGGRGRGRGRQPGRHPSVGYHHGGVRGGRGPLKRRGVVRVAVCKQFAEIGHCSRPGCKFVHDVALVDAMGRATRQQDNLKQEQLKQKQEPGEKEKGQQRRTTLGEEEEDASGPEVSAFGRNKLALESSNLVLRKSSRYFDSTDSAANGKPATGAASGVVRDEDGEEEELSDTSDDGSDDYVAF